MEDNISTDISVTEKESNSSNEVKSILQFLLLAVAIIIEGFLVLLLAGFMIFAIIIRPLAKPLQSGIDKLSTLISKQYEQMLDTIAYDGEKVVLKILSWICVLIFRVATILFLSYTLIVCLGMMFYAIFLKFLRPMLIKAARGLYYGIVNNFEIIIWMISGDGEDPSLARIIVGGIFKVLLRVGAIIADAYCIIVVCGLFIFSVWFNGLREANAGAVSRLFKRIFTHIRHIISTITNQYPDFALEVNEADDENDNVIHLKKDGTPDMRYRENKNLD